MRRFLSVVLVAGVSIAAYAQFSGPASNIPAFHDAAPTGPLPPILHGAQLTGPYFSHSFQVIAYKQAARIPAVLYQEPCYCRCDREEGHTSLESCFSTLHGAECGTCMKEEMYTYRETRRGRSPAQIRAGIERGDWMSVDLETAKM